MTAMPDLRHPDRVDRARVVRLVEAGVVEIWAGGEVVRGTYGGGLLGRIARVPTMAPRVGDWVVVRRWPGRRRTIERVLPRHSELASPAGRTIATNLDVIALPAGVDGSRWTGLDVPVVAADADELRARLRDGATVGIAPGPGCRDLLAALVGDLAGRQSGVRRLHVLPSGGAVLELPALRAVA